MNQYIYKEAAENMRQLYLALLEAGFTSNQSMDLLKTMLMAATSKTNSNKINSDPFVELIKGTLAQ